MADLKVKKMEPKFRDRLRVSVVQTILDAKIAWPRDPSGKCDFEMEIFQQEMVWNEISKAFRTLRDGGKQPQVILLPELTLGRGYRNDLIKLSESMGAITVCGVDYFKNSNNKTIENKSIVIIPPRLVGEEGSPRKSFSSEIHYIDKLYPAPAEKSGIEKNGMTYRSSHTIKAIHWPGYGTFGVAICYDLMDLERALLYRRKINHLFIIAYNKDIRSFYHLAEAFSRTIYCNVIICNTGLYSGSVAISPFYDPNKRTIFRHEGSSLPLIQTFEIPVKDLIEAASGVTTEEDSTDPCRKQKIMKAPPPGVW